MDQYTPDQIAQLLRRSYMAVDGLWFVMAEQRHGYEAALKLDEDVWKVMPKIQARKAREVLGIEGNDLEDLARCLGLKLAAEGTQYEVHIEGDQLQIRIVHCVWREVFEKAQRLHISKDIARSICLSEGAGWAAEFGLQFTFDFECSMCGGGDCCRFVFSRSEDAVAGPA
jgi:acyl-CoA thioesterase FadM